jgi:type III secretion protein V
MVGSRVKYSEFVLIVLVMAIAAMLVVPLPTFVLDLLLVCNVSFAILLLLVGLYVGNSSALFTFPSILLLSTLFLLGLNVASTRLILSQGEAGKVIEAFGTFLIRGEVVVGIIIFAIVTIVNFIVISKGASRVSEVAARFALDALPGKQMMIDNDVRSGVLSADEARGKREELRRESQLYGSMDGAMKFVQGDAIAGIMIIVANICGGIYMGLSTGMGLVDAIHTYTTLTIGDGLVSQIPALLTSICAGIIVTRVSSAESSSLSSDLHGQLFQRPFTLFMASGIIFLLALLPGIPFIPFGIASLGLMVLGMWGVRNARSIDSHQPKGVVAAVDSSKGYQDTAEGEVIGPPIVLYLDSGSLYRFYKGRVNECMAVWRAFREEFYDDTGVQLPSMEVQSSEQLNVGGYAVRFLGTELFAGTLPAEALFVELTRSNAEVLGVPVLKEERHPLSGQAVVWTPKTQNVVKLLDAARIKHCGFMGYVSLRMGYMANRHPEEFVTATYVHSSLRKIEKRHPGLIQEGFGREFVSVPKLAEILQELIRQGVSIRDFRGIVECLASFCASAGVAIDSDVPVDIAEAVHYVRASRRRQIVRRLLGSAESLPVFALSPEVEQTFEEASTDRWTTSLAMPPDLYDLLLQGLYDGVRTNIQVGSLPLALLCSREIKEKVISFIRATDLMLFVTTLDEIDPTVPVMQVGVWDFRH